MKWASFWNNVGLNGYNPVAQAEGWPQWQYMNFTEDDQAAGNWPATTTFGCKVKAMISETYGKMPDAGARNQIVMEYEYYMDIFAKSTTFDSAFVEEDLATQFIAWMQSEPNLSYHFSS